MSSSPSLKLGAQFVLVAAGALLLPALWSWFSAIWSAATTGQVLVLSVGRYETSRSMVPWPQGWARFVGPVALASSLSLWLASKSAQRIALWWSSAAIGFVGIVLLLFSQWFVSWRGSVWFSSFAVFIALSYYLGSKLGRVAMIIFMLAVFAIVGWQAGRGTWQ
jgi:hypothetical protein